MLLLGMVVVRLLNGCYVEGSETSGKRDFAIIGLGLQNIPTNSSQ